MLAIMQFIKTVVATIPQFVSSVADEETTDVAVRLYNQCNLPRMREKVAVQPGVVAGEEEPHARMGVVPTHYAFFCIALFQCSQHGNLAVVCKSKECAARTNLLRGEQGFNDDEFIFRINVLTPAPGQPTTNLIVHVGSGVVVDCLESRLRHADSNERPMLVLAFCKPALGAMQRHTNAPWAAAGNNRSNWFLLHILTG